MRRPDPLGRFLFALISLTAVAVVALAVMSEYAPARSPPTLTPPSHTPRHMARSARRPTRGRKRACIYVGVALNRA